MSDAHDRAVKILHKYIPTPSYEMYSSAGMRVIAAMIEHGKKEVKRAKNKKP